MPDSYIYKSCFDRAPIGTALIDPGGQFIEVNDTLQKLFAGTRNAAALKNLRDIVSDQDIDRLMSAIRKLGDKQIVNLEERVKCETSEGEAVDAMVFAVAVQGKPDDDVRLVMQIQDVTEATRLNNLLEYQASYDELTGLLNRRAFEAKLNSAWDSRSTGQGASHLMYMDLDQFKVVNDTSGHAAGDELLIQISGLLRDCVRTNDIVARLGGDEFGVLLWDCPANVAERIAETIRSRVSDFRFHWENETYQVGVSIGGLPVDPEVGDVSEIQQLADSACYTAKEFGRNRVHMVGGEKDSARKYRSQIRWVQRLREAMDQNRFTIYAHQILSLDQQTEEPDSAEVLLRLRDKKTRKMIPPGAFLPAAERYGLSIELDRWVVRNLLNTLFVHQAFLAEQRQYWINLSGTSITDHRFAAFLKDAIKRSPLPRGMINFEINESAVSRSVTEAKALMNDLREMGCRFALDDFSSRLSSFGVLRDLPIDRVKIDGDYVRDLLDDETDSIFVKSIIDIAHSLNIKAVAEKVESPELLDKVQALGADYAQGFAVARPYVLAPKFPELHSTNGLAGIAANG